MWTASCLLTVGLINSFLKISSSFTINLKSSDSKDIALHLNPRLKNKVFVRNSYLHDSWGEEEKEVTDFPFSPGMYFEVRLTEMQCQSCNSVKRTVALVLKCHANADWNNKTAILAFQWPQEC